MAARRTTSSRMSPGAARSRGTPHRRTARSASRVSDPPLRAAAAAARHLRVSPAEAHRLRSLLVSDEVGLIGSLILQADFEQVLGTFFII